MKTTGILKATGVTIAGVLLLAPTSATAAPVRGAAQITLDRTGGIAGTHDTWSVDRFTPGGRRVLQLAASPRFRWLRSSYQPANPCCDRYTYQVTVTYRGGSHKQVSTVDGAQAPRVLWDVINGTKQVGQHPQPGTPPVGPTGPNVPPGPGTE